MIDAFVLKGCFDRRVGSVHRALAAWGDDGALACRGCRSLCFAVQHRCNLEDVFDFHICPERTDLLQTPWERLRCACAEEAWMGNASWPDVNLPGA